jgi:DNA-binding NtrC family response regulator
MLENDGRKTIDVRVVATTSADLEKSYILNLYRKMNHNKVRTARVLGIGLNTVRRKLKSYGVK